MDGKGFERIDSSNNPFRNKGSSNKSISKDAGRGSQVLAQISCAKILPNPYQPRKSINETEIASLAESIVAQGLLQPIVVQMSDDGLYELIAGQRRLLAYIELSKSDKKYTNIPALVTKEIKNANTALAALVENLQRTDLNPMEESRALVRIQSEFNFSQEQMASELGKSRSSIANMIRLCNLETDVQKHLECGDIDLGHAKCLLAISGEEQSSACRDVIERGLTVRQTEQLIKKILTGEKNQKLRSPSRDECDPTILEIQQDIESSIDLSTKIISKGEGGRLIIDYECTHDLERVASKLKATPAN